MKGDEKKKEAISMYQLLTKKDLATRWQVDKQTINNYIKKGVIAPCKGIPAIRFSLENIEKLEDVKLEKLSPFERKRLEEDRDKWKERAEKAELLYGPRRGSGKQQCYFQRRPGSHCKTQKQTCRDGSRA